MEVVVRRYVREMITAGSNRLGFPELESNERDKIHERVRPRVLGITMDGKLILGLIVCKHCHNLYTNAKWTMPRISKHLDTFHPVARPVEEDPTSIEATAVKESKSSQQFHCQIQSQT